MTTAGGQVFAADRILLTASVGVLRSGHIAFKPDLPPRKLAALRAVDFPPGFKMLLRFSEQFYPDAVVISGNFAGGEKGKGEKGFYDMAFGKGPAPGSAPDAAHDHVLGLLATGDATTAYYALESEAQMLSAALAELDAIFDGAASRSFSGEYRLQDWGRQPYTQGSWVQGFRIGRSTLAALNEPLGGRKVYFAGEAHDVHRQLGVPGAVLSGLDAIDRLLQPAIV